MWWYICLWHALHRVPERGFARNFVILHHCTPRAIALRNTILALRYCARRACLYCAVFSSPTVVIGLPLWTCFHVSLRLHIATNVHTSSWNYLFASSSHLTTLSYAELSSSTSSQIRPYVVLSSKFGFVSGPGRARLFLYAQDTCADAVLLFCGSPWWGWFPDIRPVSSRPATTDVLPNFATVIVLATKCGDTLVRLRYLNFLFGHFLLVQILHGTPICSLLIYCRTPRTVVLRFAVIFSCQYCAHLFGICGICTLKIIPLLSASATSLASCELLIPVPSWQTRLPCFHHHLASSHVTSPLVLFLRSIYSSQCLVFCCVISFIFTVCWLLSAFLCLSHTIEIKKCFWNFFCPILFFVTLSCGSSLLHLPKYILLILLHRHFGAICFPPRLGFMFVFPHTSVLFPPLMFLNLWKFVIYLDAYAGNLFPSATSILEICSSIDAYAGNFFPTSTPTLEICLLPRRIRWKFLPLSTYTLEISPLQRRLPWKFGGLTDANAVNSFLLSTIMLKFVLSLMLMLEMCRPQQHWCWKCALPEIHRLEIGSCWRRMFQKFVPCQVGILRLLVEIRTVKFFMWFPHFVSHFYCAAVFRTFAGTRDSHMREARLIRWKFVPLSDSYIGNFILAAIEMLEICFCRDTAVGNVFSLCHI